MAKPISYYIHLSPGHSHQLYPTMLWLCSGYFHTTSISARATLTSCILQCSGYALATFMLHPSVPGPLSPAVSYDALAMLWLLSCYIHLSPAHSHQLYPTMLWLCSGYFHATSICPRPTLTSCILRCSGYALATFMLHPSVPGPLSPAVSYDALAMLWLLSYYIHQHPGRSHQLYPTMLWLCSGYFRTTSINTR